MVCDGATACEDLCNQIFEQYCMLESWMDDVYSYMAYIGLGLSAIYKGQYPIIIGKLID